MYYIAAIIAGASAAAAMFIKESHADQLLEGRVNKVRKEPDNKDTKTVKSKKTTLLKPSSEILFSKLWNYYLGNQWWLTVLYCVRLLMDSSTALQNPSLSSMNRLVGQRQLHHLHLYLTH